MNTNFLPLFQASPKVVFRPRASGWTQKAKYYPFKNNEDETIVAAKLDYSSIIIHLFFAVYSK